jgi:hypothetical protein
MASPDSRDSVEAVADYSAVSMRSQSLIKIPMRLRAVRPLRVVRGLLTTINPFSASGSASLWVAGPSIERAS